MGETKKKKENKGNVEEKSTSEISIEETSIEELFAQLDGIIEKLEAGEISLEDSFKYYETGVKLLKNCNEKIDRVEKQIVVLNETAGQE